MTHCATKARLVDAPMADFGHLVELALRLQNLILADSSREFARHTGSRLNFGALSRLDLNVLNTRLLNCVFENFGNYSKPKQQMLRIF